MGTLERVLREVALPPMPDHGMTPVGLRADREADTLYQISRHAGLEAVQGDWHRLRADPCRQAGARERRGGGVRVTTMLLSDLDHLPPAHLHDVPTEQPVSPEGKTAVVTGGPGIGRA